MKNESFFVQNQGRSQNRNDRIQKTSMTREKFKIVNN